MLYYWLCSSYIADICNMQMNTATKQSLIQIILNTVAIPDKFHAGQSVTGLFQYVKRLVKYALISQYAIFGHMLLRTNYLFMVLGATITAAPVKKI